MRKYKASRRASLMMDCETDLYKRGVIDRAEFFRRLRAISAEDIKRFSEFIGTVTP